MSKQNSTEPNRRLQLALEEIGRELQDLKYGSLQVIVQDGIVIQIDKTVKSRIDYSSLDKVNGGEGI